MVLVSGRDGLQVGLEAFLVVEEQIGEFLEGEDRVCVRLDGASVQSCGLVESRCESDLVEAEEEVLYADPTLGAAVPLRKYTMQVGP